MRAINRSQSSNPRGQILLPFGDRVPVLSSLQIAVEHCSGAFPSVRMDVNRRLHRARYMTTLLAGSGKNRTVMI
jgi:hypothetical protein